MLSPQADQSHASNMSLKASIEQCRQSRTWCRQGRRFKGQTECLPAKCVPASLKLWLFAASPRWTARRPHPSIHDHPLRHRHRRTIFLWAGWWERKCSSRGGTACTDGGASTGGELGGGEGEAGGRGGCTCRRRWPAVLVGCRRLVSRARQVVPLHARHWPAVLRWPARRRPSPLQGWHAVKEGRQLVLVGGQG